MDLEKKPMNPNEYHQLDSRVASLESDVMNLVRAVDRQREDTDRAFTRLSEEISELGNRVSTGTNWGVLGTWSAVLLTLIGGLGVLAMAPLRAEVIENHKAIQEGMRFFFNHVSDGHPESVVQKVTTNEVAIKNLDTNLQREMRDLDTGQTMEISRRLEALDKLLQTEIGNVSNILAIETKTLDGIELWVRDHMELNSRTDAGQEERLKVLEKAILKDER